MTTSSIPTIIAIVLCVAFIAWVKIWQKIKIKREDELRQLWRRKIEQIADDRSTDPDGLSLDDVMDFLDEPFWRDVYDALEKMPRGQRSLQKAIELVDHDD